MFTVIKLFDINVLFLHPRTHVQDGSMFGGECQEGYYCPVGSSKATSVACPVGTYNPLKGGANSSACLPCSGGKSINFSSLQFSLYRPSNIPLYHPFNIPLYPFNILVTPEKFVYTTKRFFLLKQKSVYRNLLEL